MKLFLGKDSSTFENKREFVANIMTIYKKLDAVRTRQRSLHDLHVHSYILKFRTLYESLETIADGIHT